MKRAAPWLLAAALVGCDGAPATVHAVSVPRGPILVPVGARHDVLVAACRDEIALGRLLEPAAVAALFVGFGRLDAALAVPDALIRAAVPDCEPVDLAVRDPRVAGPLRFEGTANPRGFTVIAEGRGEGVFEATAVVDGGAQDVATTVWTLLIDRVRFDPHCDGGLASEGRPVAAPVGSTLRVTEQWFATGRPLTGYGIEPIEVASGPAVRIERTDAVRLTLDAPGRTVLRSPHDPDFERTLLAYTDADISALWITTGPEPWLAGGRYTVGTGIEVDGDPACLRADTPRLTIETPAVCRFPDGALEVEAATAPIEALAPGPCIVAGRSGPAEARFEQPVLAPFETVATLDPRDTLRGVWARGPGDVHVVGERGGRGLVARIEGGAPTFEADPDWLAPLVAVDGAGETVVAVGAGVLWIADGGLDPDPDPMFADVRLTAVRVAAPDDVWVAGADGFAARFHGRGWTRVDPGHAAAIGAIHVEGDGVAVLSGSGPPIRWQGGVATPLPTPDGGPGGGVVRPVGDALWFLARPDGPFALDAAGPRPIPFAVDWPGDVIDLHRHGEAHIVRLRNAAYHVTGDLADPAGWRRLSAFEGGERLLVTPTSTFSVADRLYVANGHRLMALDLR